MKFLRSANQLKGYVYASLIALSIVLPQSVFATGSEVGRGDDGSAAYKKYYGYCSGAIGILERALRMAYLQNGDSAGVRRILIKGLTDAKAQIPDGEPLTKNAIDRGLTLNDQFQNGCTNVNDPTQKAQCQDREVRTAEFFLEQWYHYVIDTVYPLDADYYINYYDYRRGYAHYHSDHCGSDEDGSGDYDDHRGHHHGHTDDYHCWSRDWGSVFYTAYKDAARSLLNFYTGSRNGMPDALAMDGYELHVAEQVFTWASQDLTLDIFNRAFECVTTELQSAAQDIAAFNAGDISQFRSSRQAVIYARDVSDYNALLLGQHVCGYSPYP